MMSNQAILTMNDGALPTHIEGNLMTPEVFDKELKSIEDLYVEYEQKSRARWPLVVAAIVAIGLLLVWAGTIIQMILIAPEEPKGILVQIVPAINALISALLIAILTTSDPQQNPALHYLGSSSVDAQRKLAHVIYNRYSNLYQNLANNLNAGKIPLPPEMRMPPGYENVEAGISTLQSRVERMIRYYPDPIRQTLKKPNILHRLIINPLNDILSDLYPKVIALYVASWLIVSVILVTVVWFGKQSTSEALQTMAMTQFGIAIAAAYAYLGIKPPAGTSGN